MQAWLLSVFLGAICGKVGLLYLKRFLLSPVADRQTAEDRRKKLPVGKRAEKPPPSLLDADWEGRLVDVNEGFFTLPNQKKLYWCTLTPKDITKVERALIYFHGYTGSSAWTEFNAMATFAALGGCAVIGFDMPGHGRSDGLHIYVEDWHSFVGCAQQFVEKFAKARQQEWSERAGRQLRLFALGESMGGGVVTTLCLKHPQLFDGVILFSPMIAVSEQTMPHPIVVWLFKNVICALLPEWPIAPAKDISAMVATDPEIISLLRSNPFGERHSSPKLQTAKVLAFQAPEWMGPRLAEFATPFLIVHAAGDRVTDPELSKKLHQVSTCEDKSLNLYDKAQHVDPLHGGPKMKELVQTVYSDIFEWLQKRS